MIKTRFCIIFLLLIIPTAIMTAAQDASEGLAVVEQLCSEGKYDEARRTCDSIHYAMHENYERQYDSRVVPVRLETRAQEIELAAQRERNKLTFNVCMLAAVLLSGGVLLYLLIHLENKRMVHSAQEMKEATDRAEMAEKSKSMFLSNMTHEIRAPLNAISGFADVLATDGIDEDMRREAADIIEMNSNMLHNLIDDVVGTTCTDMRQMKFRVVPCDVVKLSRNVTEMISKIKKTDAEMSFETVDKEIMVMVDPLRLQQVMVNVLVNATKFCKQGSIVLKVEREDDNARISVTDTGIGIPPEKQASVFGRYERVGETAEGFGLGLSICKFIIEHMGGKIWVDGTYTGGARFVFTVPFESPLQNEAEEGGMA